jgi:hypothetical protein
MNILGGVTILRRYQILEKLKGRSDAADVLSHISLRSNTHQ